jgi:hypothetical protein
MTEQILETKSLEDAIHEAIIHFETFSGNSIEAGDALGLTRAVSGGIAAYVVSLTHKDFIAFARAMLQQGFAYAVEAKYPLGIQQALARAHDQLLEEEKRL